MRLFIITFLLSSMNTCSMQPSARNTNLVYWTISAELPAAKDKRPPLGLAGPVAGVHQNVMIIGGGANFPDAAPWEGGKKKYYSEAYIYFFKGENDIQYKKTDLLPDTIAYAACCSSPKGIVYAGGENASGFSKKSVLLQWDREKETLQSTSLPDLPYALSNAAAAILGSVVYIAGGETTTGVSDQFYCLDLDHTTEGWKTLPALPQALSHGVFIALENKAQTSLYLAGGRHKNKNGVSDLFATLFEFDAAKNEWQKKAPMPYALSAGTGIGIDKERFMLFGGDKGETFHQVETLLAAIGAEKDALKKQELIQQKNKLQAAHPGFSREVLLYDATTDRWTTSGDMPFETPVTTTAFKWGDLIVIPSGEIRAGVRTPRIISAKRNKNERF